MNFEQYKKMLLGGNVSQEEKRKQVIQWLQEDPAAFEALLAEEARAIEHNHLLPEAIRQQMLAFFWSKRVFPASRLKTAIIEMDNTGFPPKGPGLRWTAAASVIIGSTTAAGLAGHIQGKAQHFRRNG